MSYEQSCCLIGAQPTLRETEQFRSINKTIEKALRAVSEPRKRVGRGNRPLQCCNMLKGDPLCFGDACTHNFDSGASKVEFIFPNMLRLVTSGIRQSLGGLSSGVRTLIIYRALCPSGPHF